MPTSRSVVPTLAPLTKRQRGFAAMEYCIVCALVVMVLFANPNLPQLLVNAVKAFYRSLTFFISLP